MKFFPNVEIVEYKYIPTFEVIFQVEFPDIAKISNENPVEFQKKVRDLGYHSFEVEDQSDQDLQDSDTKVGSNPIFHFISDEKGLRTLLRRDSIGIICFKDYSNIKSFEQHIKDVLENFIDTYKEFGIFTEINLIHRNILNKTFISNLDTELGNIIPKHIFPELHEENSQEVGTIRKTCIFNHENIRARTLHIFGKLSGEYGNEYIHDELSYIIDILCTSETGMKEISDVSKHYNTIAQICWNALHYGITEEIRSNFIG